MNAVQSLTCKAHAVHRACSYRVTGLLIQTYKHSQFNDQFMNYQRYVQDL